MKPSRAKANVEYPSSAGTILRDVRGDGCSLVVSVHTFVSGLVDSSVIFSRLVSINSPSELLLDHS